jgi:hypothetical protein
MARTRAPAAAREAAETIAAQALSFLAGEPERLTRFLTESGLDVARVRAAAQEPGFLAGVLDHVTSDESLLIAFASEAGMTPADVERARITLSGAAWERDIP